MELRINKKTVSTNFLEAAQNYKVAETEKIITVRVPLDGVQEAKLGTGQLTKAQVRRNIHFWIY